MGAMSVLVTLLYLARQLRQNAKATRSQTAQSVFQLSYDFLSSLADPKRAELWAKMLLKGVDAFEEGDDRIMAGVLCRSMFTTYDNHHYQYHEGNLSQEIHEAFERRLLKGSDRLPGPIATLNSPTRSRTEAKDSVFGSPSPEKGRSDE